MATKKMKELRNLSHDELISRIRETRQKLFDAKIQFATGQLENVKTNWVLRKELARIYTLLSEKQRELVKQA